MSLVRARRSESLPPPPETRLVTVNDQFPDLPETVTVHLRYVSNRSRMIFHRSGKRVKCSSLRTFVDTTLTRLCEQCCHHVFDVENWLSRQNAQFAYEHLKPKSLNPKPKNQYAQTPECIYRFLEHEYSVAKSALFDPCPVKPTFNGLEIEWSYDNVYCNPPFAKMKQWTEKIYKEHYHHNSAKRVFLLCPARTGPKWWHEFIQRYCTRVINIKSRLTFKGYPDRYGFGIALCVIEKQNVNKNDSVMVESIDMHKLYDPGTDFKVHDTKQRRTVKKRKRVRTKFIKPRKHKHRQKVPFTELLSDVLSCNLFDDIETTL